MFIFAKCSISVNILKNSTMRYFSRNIQISHNSRLFNYSTLIVFIQKHRKIQSKSYSTIENFIQNLISKEGKNVSLSIICQRKYANFLGSKNNSATLDRPFKRKFAFRLSKWKSIGRKTCSSFFESAHNCPRTFP